MCVASGESRLLSLKLESKPETDNLKRTEFQPPNDKTNTMTCAPSEDSDQPEHPPNLIRVFPVRSMGG